MKHRKIVFVHLLNDYSGSPKVLSQVIKAVQKQGYEIELYTGKSENGFLSGLTDKHHYYFYKHFGNKYLTLISFMLSQLSLFFKLLRHRNEEVVIYVNTMLPFAAGLAGAIMAKPVYYHIHETSLQPASFKQFLRFIIQKTASRIFFVSNYVKKAESFKEITQEVIYNALPATFVKVADQNIYRPLKEGGFNVLMICSLRAYKGVDEFIDIARQSEVQKQITFTLVLNAEQSDVDAYFGKISLPKNILLVSRQTNLVPYYQQASLLLNLSRVDEWVETFGLTILEAMAFGIPVIVPPVGGPVEIVTEGGEGFLISSYEQKKIRHKIIELSVDEALCLTLSKQGKNRSNDFRQELFDNAILRVINE